MVCGLGAISLGYDRLRLRKNGDESLVPLMSLPMEYESTAAQSVIEGVAPWADQVRFTKTGSEAVQAAVVCARSTTGRHDVIVANGSYHGWHSMFQQGGVGYYEYGSSPDWITEDIALVLIEPSRWEYTAGDWVQSVIEQAHKMGALVAMDEMVYGLRWAMGGATEIYNIEPDFACYGKALGNGFPIACVVGKENVMAYSTDVSGTYSGEMLSLSAVMSVVDCYRDNDVIEHMWTIGRHIENGLTEVVKNKVVAREGAAVHQRLVFANRDTAHRFASHMAHRGILWHPDVMNVSYAHTLEDADRVVGAAAAVLREMGL